MNRAQRRAAGQRGQAKPSINLEYRVRRGWLVRFAAYTRSWPLVKFAARFVRLDGRPKGGAKWLTLDVRPAIEEDGTVKFVPIGSAE